MRNLLFLLFCLPISIYGQTNSMLKFLTADSLLQNYKIEEAYLTLKQLELELPQTDSLYQNVLWYQVQIASLLEEENRTAQNFEKSLEYGVESLELIGKGKKLYDEDFAKREPFMIKNIIVSNVGLGRYDSVKEYKDLLYKLHKDKNLPNGIDEYFNFDYFKWQDKNIWGYEWYAELPEDRFSSSFTKIVYYVYSTNPDGSDKEQLYRLHLLMFHAFDADFDYVLTKYTNTNQGEVRKTLYAYTYKENIDYKKLKNDVIRVLEGKAELDMEMMINQQKD